MSRTAEVSFKDNSMWSNQSDKKFLLLQGVVKGRKQLTFKKISYYIISALAFINNDFSN